jgi:hypothetical protein
MTRMRAGQMSRKSKKGAQPEIGIFITNGTGVLLAILGIFMMSWVTTGVLTDFLNGPLGDGLTSLLETQDVNVIPYLQELLNSIHGPSGWELATEVPTVGWFLRIVLFLPILSMFLGIFSIFFASSGNTDLLASVGRGQVIFSGIIPNSDVYLYYHQASNGHQWYNVRERMSFCRV